MTDSNAVSYTGHTTAWGGFNVNEQTQNSTFTFSLKLTGSDGSTIVARQVDHFTLNANGNVTTSFDTTTLTCG